MRIRTLAFMADIGAAGAMAIDPIIAATVPTDMVIVPTPIDTATVAMVTAAEATHTAIVPVTPTAAVVRTLAEVATAPVTDELEASAEATAAGTAELSVRLGR
jgi:hypothetical protein